MSNLNRDSNQEIDFLRQEILALRLAHCEHERGRRQIEATLRDSQAETLMLAAQIKELRNSTSWRLTAPLRLFSIWFRFVIDRLQFRKIVRRVCGRSVER